MKQRKQHFPVTVFHLFTKNFALIETDTAGPVASVALTTGSISRSLANMGGGAVQTQT
jgi:hypothetical protein